MATASLGFPRGMPACSIGLRSSGQRIPNIKREKQNYQLEPSGALRIGFSRSCLSAGDLGSSLWPRRGSVRDVTRRPSDAVLALGEQVCLRMPRLFSQPRPRFLPFFAHAVPSFFLGHLPYPPHLPHFQRHFPQAGHPSTRPTAPTVSYQSNCHYATSL